MASPTQNEEAHMGYDSQVKLPDGRYVLLQFKRPLPCRPPASFEVPSGQVSALLGPHARSSFFALPAVGTNGEMWDARAALLDRTIVVDAWDLYAPFAVSMNDQRWIYRSKKKASKTVRVDLEDGAGYAATVSQGRGPKKFASLPSMPISCLCCSGGYGFAVKGGAILARGGGGTLDRKKYQDAVEARRQKYCDLYPSMVGDGPRARDPRPSDRLDGEAPVGSPGMDVLRTVDGGGSGSRYTIRIGDP